MCSRDSGESDELEDSDESVKEEVEVEDESS